MPEWIKRIWRWWTHLDSFIALLYALVPPSVTAIFVGVFSSSFDFVVFSFICFYAGLAGFVAVRGLHRRFGPAALPTVPFSFDTRVTGNSRIAVIHIENETEVSVQLIGRLGRVFIDGKPLHVSIMRLAWLEGNNHVGPKEICNLKVFETTQNVTIRFDGEDGYQWEWPIRNIETIKCELRIEAHPPIVEPMIFVVESSVFSDGRMASLSVNHTHSAKPKKSRLRFKR